MSSLSIVSSSVSLPPSTQFAPVGAPLAPQAPTQGPEFQTSRPSSIPGESRPPRDAEFARATATNEPESFAKGRMATCEARLTRLSTELKAAKAVSKGEHDPAVAELHQEQLSALLDLQGATFEMTSSFAIVSQVVGSVTNGVKTLMQSQS